ncbi:MAG: hypothetical protein WAM82_36780 [Thermoanaerobaculia bacterium]
MYITIRLIFFGLVAFAPHNNDYMDVLVLDARGPQWASDGCDVPEHYPAMLVAADKCRKDKLHCDFSPELEQRLGYPTEVWERHEDKRELSGSWLLDKGEMTISFIDGDGKQVILSGGPKYVRKRGDTCSHIPASAKEAADFSWIPNPKPGSIVNSNCLKADGDCPIVASLRLYQGTVGTCHLVETSDPNPQICPFEFSGLLGSGASGDIDPQAVADGVMVRFEVPLEYKLSLSAMSGGKKFELQLGAGKDKSIDVFIVNLPVYGHKNEGCHGPKLDRHFELYYNVSQPDPSGMPIRFDKRPIPKLMSSVEPCAPLSFQPETVDECPLLKFERSTHKPSAAAGQLERDRRIPLDKPACGTRQFLAPLP